MVRRAAGPPTSITDDPQFDSGTEYEEAAEPKGPGSPEGVGIESLRGEIERLRNTINLLTVSQGRIMHERARLFDMLENALRKS